MKEFFILTYAPEGRIGDAVELAKSELHGFDYLRLKEGISLGSLPSTIDLRVQLAAGTSLDANVVTEPHGWTIVSTVIATKLRTVARDDVELLSISIRDMEGVPYPKDFFAVNCLRMLDALSEQISIRGKPFLGGRRPVLKLGIVTARVPDNIHVFRVRGSESDLIVDNVLKNAIESVPHDGLAFVRVSQE